MCINLDEADQLVAAAEASLHPFKVFENFIFHPPVMKAKALIDNRFAATIEDVRAVSRQVFEHRIILNFKAEAENIKVTDMIEKLIKTVKT